MATEDQVNEKLMDPMADVDNHNDDKRMNENDDVENKKQRTRRHE